MRVRCAVVVVLFLGTLAGCSSGPEDSPATPELGATPPTVSSPPATPMDDLEQPVADRLAGPLRRDGLTLEHVTCPTWAGVLPTELECQAYVDGVVGTVEVRLTRGSPDGVEFDATLDEGVVATQKLVDRLEAEGASEADCGDTPAYPADVGLRLVCRVVEDGAESHVVATVTDRAGEVRIEDY